ncbi:MAG: hypothetical protein LC105_05985 [Chitinophagales bacterium]|nr:hypothetical protein [Chitinophagales bacterium]
MPHFWEEDTNKVAVTIDELVPAFFNTWNTLESSIYRTRRKKYGIKKLNGRACYGKPVLIDYDTLPLEIRNMLADPRKPKHQLERWFKIDPLAVKFYSHFRFENGTHLSIRHQQEYILNAAVLVAIESFKQAHIAKKTALGVKPTKLYQLMAREAQTFQSTLVKYHGGNRHTLPPSERAFRRVYDGFFLDDGLDYLHLISGKLQNDNAKILKDKEQEILDSLFARAGSKPNKTRVVERYQAFLDGEAEVINTSTGEAYQPDEFNKLSATSINRWLSAWESRIATHNIRSADRQKYMEQYKVSAKMTPPTYAGSIFSIDDRQPPFEYGPSARIWMYNGVDVASQAIIVSVDGRTKEGMMLNFHRNTVRNHVEYGTHLPYELEAEVSLNKSFTDTFLKEGVMYQRVRLIPNNARAKYIERINRELRLFLEKEMEGFIGRWNALDESNQPLPKDGIYRTKKYLTYDQIRTQSYKLIEVWNNMPHPRHPEMSRWDYYLQHQQPKLQPTNWNALLPQIGIHTDTSCKVGKIQLQKQDYWLGHDGEIATGQPLIQLLKQIEGRDVEVYWLDDNYGNVLKALVFLNGTQICEALPIPEFNRASIERTEQDKLNMKIQFAYINTVETFLKARKAEIDPVIFIDHRQHVVNNNFKMPGNVLADEDYYPASTKKQGEILEDLPEEPVYEYQTSSWKDRF